MNKHQVDFPCKACGDWKIEKFEVTKQEADLHNMRCAFTRRDGFIVPGTYTRLTRNGTIVMSDTPSEINDHLGFIYVANGRVLVAGLGLGVVVSALCAKEDVDSVTVIEKSKDVISLVAEYIRHEKLTVIEADIFTWKPPKGVTWDFAWFDIWDTICEDNIKEMSRLHRKFARRVKVKDSWQRDYLLRLRNSRKGLY